MKHLLIFALLCLFFACNNDQGARGDLENDGTATEVNTTQTGWDRNRVAEFMNEAASAGMMEVQLGQLAQQQGSSQQVKDFGQMMVQDHSQANQQLQNVAQGMQMTLPAVMMEKHQEHVNDLQAKSGADFDNAYMDMMVKDHREDVNKFEQAQRNVTDAALKGWIDNTLPTLRTHLEHAQAVNDQINM